MSIHRKVFLHCYGGQVKSMRACLEPVVNSIVMPMFYVTQNARAMHYLMPNQSKRLA